MKKLIPLGLVLVMLVSILSGCSFRELLSDKELTFDDLTITVPGTYVNMKLLTNNPDLAFVYGIGDTAVLGIQETIVDVQNAVGYHVETAADYAMEYIIQNRLMDARTQTTDGIVNFTYTAEVEGQSFTYLSAAFVNDEHFWLVQTYCYTENFEANKADFWECIQSVTLS